MPAIIGWLTTILYNPNNVGYSERWTRRYASVDLFRFRSLSRPAQLLTKSNRTWGCSCAACLGLIRPPKSSLGDTLRAGQRAEKQRCPERRVEAGGSGAGRRCTVDASRERDRWAARNLKFYPLPLHAAMTQGEKPLAFIASDFKVVTCEDPNTPKLFSTLKPWQLLNLTSAVILDIPDKLLDQYGITSEFLATLVGIGSESCVNVFVDNNARMDMDELRKKLQACVDEKQAVYAIVVVIGSTEEGAADPLDKILELRTELAAKGLSFLVHADPAWCGCICMPSDRDYVPSVTLRKSIVDQFRALKDVYSITIDPHKAGYIPYPAGGLCYRDGRIRFLLTWTAPYLHQGKGGESIGIYGIQGSSAHTGPRCLTTTIDDILKANSFKASISSVSGVRIPSGTISITAVVKNRPLNSCWRDPLYPASFTPFYLYGTPFELHVESSTTSSSARRTPRSHPTLSLLTPKLEPALTAAQLACGLIARVDRSEAALHALPSRGWAQGPGLLEGGSQIAKGTLGLGKMVYVDCEKLNEDPEYVGLGVQSVNGFIGNMRQATRMQWVEVVEKALGRVQGGDQDA
ncbi:hypothetical protein DFH08DRAFT_1024786 [Mycena albidolilacea]|uniref:Pyridoxal phosphate-dependent transferase n=1 Tax=Mycena albidolilacea TaxID=1033008 RepID=A0AAD7F353_9AGAR|nr:hypothetical protein DFH08DRAFT_1024786 [Mycena albidolilacea]